MNIISLIMLIFAVLGAVDRIIGNKFGLGKEFEKGFEMLGVLALSMLGIMTLAPFLADVMKPALDLISNHTPFDPSVFTSAIFTNDSGGAPLADRVAVDKELGAFNGLIVGAMMGCTVSFTVPFALSATKKEYHGKILLGLLCGITTVPVGCFVSGLMAGIPILKLLINLLPLLVFSVLIALGLWKIPGICTELFRWIGLLLRGLITIGLIIGVIHLITGYTPIKNIVPLTENVGVILSCSAMMCGAFPMIAVLSRILKKPLEKAGEKLKIKKESVMGILTTLATSVPTYGKVSEMDDLGVILNSAFSVSAAFLLTDHLAFTMAYNDRYVWPLLAGKLVSGLLAFAVAWLIGKRKTKK